MLEVVGSTPTFERCVLNLSAPKILQRPAPQQGAQLFGAPRPERPSAPANSATAVLASQISLKGARVCVVGSYFADCCSLQISLKGATVLG